MAETDGFEPSKGFKALASLAVRCFRPLSHVSIKFLLLFRYGFVSYSDTPYSRLA